MKKDIEYVSSEVSKVFNKLIDVLNEAQENKLYSYDEIAINLMQNFIDLLRRIKKN